MTYLRNSILATLVYYDILDLPLTLLEIHKYLINPGRLSRIEGGVGDISMANILEELDSLARAGLAGHKNGFYFLYGKDEIYDRRIVREKITAAKWKKSLRLAKWFLSAPFMKGLFISGSLAINNAHPESDFDVLVIASSGRLYTCRVFLLLISALLGARRKRFDVIAPDKFCLNHYITDNDLTISHQSLYNAQTYANLKPILMSTNLAQDFYVANIWINKFVHNFRVNDEFVRRSPSYITLLAKLAKAWEFLLGPSFGDKVERIAKNYQQKRIKSNPITYEKDGRVTFNDNELEFHPRSFEKVIIQKYNQGLRKLGIIPYIEEKDSGLTR